MSSIIQMFVSNALENGSIAHGNTSIDSPVYLRNKHVGMWRGIIKLKDWQFTTPGTAWVSTWWVIWYYLVSFWTWRNELVYIIGSNVKLFGYLCDSYESGPLKGDNSPTFPVRVNLDIVTYHDLQCHAWYEHVYFEFPLTLLSEYLTGSIILRSSTWT